MKHRVRIPFAVLLGVIFSFSSAFSVYANTPDALGCCRFDFSDETVWRLDSGEGRRLENVAGVSGTVLEITGDGTHSSAWTYREFPFADVCVHSAEMNDAEADEHRLAAVRFKARRVAGAGGWVMTGPEFANRDVPVSAEWQTISYIVMLPRHFAAGDLRFGQWMQAGTFQFAELEIFPVFLARNYQGFSAEEKWEVNTATYSFRMSGGDGYARKVDSVTATFNTNRWCFGDGAFLTYRFTAYRAAYEAALEFRVSYHTGGELLAEYSPDGDNWTEITLTDPEGNAARVSTVGVYRANFTVKEEARPQAAHVRFRMVGDGLIQIISLDFAGRFSWPRESAESPWGESYFWEIRGGDADFPFSGIGMRNMPLMRGGRFAVYQGVSAAGTEVQTIHAAKQRNSPEKHLEVARFRPLNPFYCEDYGYSLSEDVWWCEAAYKIPRDRPSPEKDNSEMNTAVRLKAAGNDYESAQIVLRPNRTLTLESVTPEPLKNADGHEIPAENITVLSQFYHFIENPTDETCVRDFMPDALPPLSFPVTVPPGRNTPLWVTVYVPADTPAGEYAGNVTLQFKNKTIQIPLAVTVWGFNLPAKNHVETAFGFNHHLAFRYHGVKTDADRRKILDAYHQLLSRYRISPYDPAPLDHFDVKFFPDSENPENSWAEIDFSRYDRAVSAALEKYHFTGIMIPLPGMGGGSFHGRVEPEILGFGENTPEYQAMFRSMMTRIETHFAEKDWLKSAYTYWFDEPEEKDYAFVKNGMNQIVQYAPKIRTMITEEPPADADTEDPLGKIDIWCPVTPSFNLEIAEKLMARGDVFWWYICCWPKAPYCTEFIDHPAGELRTWLWQAWERRVTGVLIWDTNYWTSGTAFPDPQSPQDPYADPMSYVSGYGTPPGEKQPWGNGDGRFLYPPLSCRTPSPAPNFDAPVSSIRLAMLREGIEDYEMLFLLREELTKNTTLAPEKRAEYESLLIVPPEITETLTKFSDDPQNIYRRREKIAEAIMEIFTGEP